MVKVHDDWETQSPEDYERDDPQVDGRVAGERREVPLGQGTEPGVAEGHDRVKDRLKNTLAKAKTAANNAESEDHSAQSFDDERDRGYLPEEPESVARRVCASELLTNGEQVAKPHTLPHQQRT